MLWPRTVEELHSQQRALAARTPGLWRRSDSGLSIGGCFVCFPRGGGGSGAAGDPAWAAAVCLLPGGGVETQVVAGAAGAPYRTGLLALREGALLEAAVLSLARLPDVLLVNATGRDHPRGAGLALHLGAVLGVPSVGVTHRPLLAVGEWPEPVRGDSRPLQLEAHRVGHMLCTRRGCRPLAVHAAWRTDPEIAAEVVLAASSAARTPEPIRKARQAARKARAAGFPARA